MNPGAPDLRELYQEVIFDHNRKQRNYRPMADANRHADGHNPLCGDQLTVYLHIEDEVVRDVSFVGQGCAISTASASLMTFAADKLAALSGVREFPARVKCATLAWHTLHNAIIGAQDPARTE